MGHGKDKMMGFRVFWKKKEYLFVHILWLSQADHALMTAGRVETISPMQLPSWAIASGGGQSGRQGSGVGSCGREKEANCKKVTQITFGKVLKDQNILVNDCHWTVFPVLHEASMYVCQGLPHLWLFILKGFTQVMEMELFNFTSTLWVSPVSHPSFSSWDQVLCRLHTQSSHPVMAKNRHKILAWSFPPEHNGNSSSVTNLRWPIPKGLGFLLPWYIKEIVTGLAGWVLGEFYVFIITVGVTGMSSAGSQVQLLGVHFGHSISAVKDDSANTKSFSLCSQFLLSSFSSRPHNNCILWQEAESFLRKMGRSSHQVPHTFNVNHGDTYP